MEFCMSLTRFCCGRYPFLNTGKSTPIIKSRHFSPMHSSVTIRTKFSLISKCRHSESSSSSSFSAPLHSRIPKSKIHFCQSCGGPTKYSIPEGEEKHRAICTVCGNVFYENPKMVVGCLIEHDNKVLLCKRKIPPSYGFWTLPAGYLELGESAAAGAVRETLEEACADVDIVSPFAQIDIPQIGQSYTIFRGRLKVPYFSPGPESLECKLFHPDKIPFESLAFSSVIVTLRMFIEDGKAGKFHFHYCVIDKRPGSSPSDTRGFHVSQHIRSDV